METTNTIPVRGTLATRFPVELTVYRKWQEIMESKDSLSDEDLTRRLRAVSYIAGKAIALVEGEASFRSKGQLRLALNGLTKIRRDAQEMLNSFQ